MPMPNDGENEEDFIARCMGDDESNADFPDRDQRFAFCQLQWGKKKKNMADEQGTKDDKKKKDAEGDDINVEPLHEIKDVEIFRTGKWNGDKYTEADLDSMVAAFDKVGYRPPVKLGHSKDVGGRAFGWVARLRRVGDRLLADFVDVPRSLYTLIKGRAFDSVSSEIFWELERNGKKFARALKAVALLGAEIPAVSDLKPLRESVLSFEANEFDRLISCELDWTERTEKDMTKTAELTVEQLAEKVAELTAKLDADTKAAADREKALKDEAAAKDAKIAELTSKEADKDNQLKEMGDRMKAVEEDQARTRESARLAKLDSKSKAIKFPVLRDAFYAAYNFATQDTRTVKYSEKGEPAKDVTLESLLDTISDRINKMAETLGTTMSIADSTVRPEGVDENPGLQVDRLVKELRAKDPSMAYADAMKRVLDADPVLKAAYATARN